MSLVNNSIQQDTQQSQEENSNRRNQLKYNLYNTENNFSKKMEADEFAERLLAENDVANYFPKDTPKDLLKQIKKSVFAKPKLYRGIDAREFDFLIENKFLHSNGEYNFANQQGQTLFDEMD